MTSLLPTPEPPDPVEGALGHFEHTNWVKASLKALDAGLLRRAGDTVLGALTINNSQSEQADLILVGATFRSIWGYLVDKPRWRLVLGDDAAETGADAGANFQLNAYGDDGAAKTVLAFNRKSGLGTVQGAPTVANGIATKKYVDSSVPLGTIIMFGGPIAKIPAGWHACDGTPHGSQALQDLIGSVNTPDLQSRFIVGAGPAYAQGATGGADSVVLTTAQTPVKSHSHSIDHDHGSKWSGAGTAHSHTINHDHPSVNSSENTHSHTLSIREGTGENDGYFLDTNPTDSGTVKTLSGSKTSDYKHYHSVNVPAFNGSSGPESSHIHSVSVPAFDGNSGSTFDNSATAHENRPPYYALLYIIKKV